MSAPLRKRSNPGDPEVERGGRQVRRKQATRPDGRSCRLCGAKDDQPDIVHTDSLWPWGYTPTADGKNRGRVCYYCFRVYQARYEPKGCSIPQLENDVGTNDEAHKTFFAYVEQAKQIFLDHGGFDVAPDWSVL